MIFASHASDHFNAWMREVVTQIAGDCETTLGRDLVALLLGGGYGRGEGGVVRKEAREQPYNDLDFTLVVRRRRRDLAGPLRAISHKYEKVLGIDVDFSRPLTLYDIQNWPHILMWQDLLNGHHVLSGPADILQANAPPALNEPLPAIEATRLLLNRGAGLLWALRILRGHQSAPDPTFLPRNYYKAALALGDALLIACGHHHVRCDARLERFTELARSGKLIEIPDMHDLYTRAVAFKLRPDEAFGEEMGEPAMRAMGELWGKVFLHVENLRANRGWRSVDEYIADTRIREIGQNQFTKWPGNILRNLRLGRLSARYPRETLYRSLPGLLGLTSGAAADWPRAGHEFLRIWGKFN